MTERRVVNTSPLIYLSRAGLIELLKTDVDEVVVPRAVADEINNWPTADDAQQALASIAWLRVAEPKHIPPAITAWDLGYGESAVLAYAIAHPGHVLVLDDLAARRCAAAMGLRVRGTLGLVLQAKKSGALPSARDALRKLHDAGMYLSQELRDAALQQIGE